MKRKILNLVKRFELSINWLRVYEYIVENLKGRTSVKRWVKLGNLRSDACIGIGE